MEDVPEMPLSPVSYNVMVSNFMVGQNQNISPDMESKWGASQIFAAETKPLVKPELSEVDTKPSSDLLQQTLSFTNPMGQRPVNIFEENHTTVTRQDSKLKPDTYSLNNYQDLSTPCLESAIGQDCLIAFTSSSAIDIREEVINKTSSDHENMSNSGSSSPLSLACNTDDSGMESLSSNSPAAINDRPFGCTICKKSFKKLDHLSEHFNSKHNQV